MITLSSQRWVLLQPPYQFANQGWLATWSPLLIPAKVVIPKVGDITKSLTQHAFLRAASETITTSFRPLSCFLSLLLRPLLLCCCCRAAAVVLLLLLLLLPPLQLLLFSVNPVGNAIRKDKPLVLVCSPQTHATYQSTPPSRHD